MALRIGPFDPIGLILNVLNALMAKNLLTKDEVKNIIRDSLPPEMSHDEKENFLNNLFLPDAGSTQQGTIPTTPVQPSA